jgi:hypothetical protein
MPHSGRRGLTAAWVGFTLAALFLYPLAGALADDVFYLQWQRRDSVAALVALALLWLPCAVAVYAIWPLPTASDARQQSPARRSGRGTTLALMAVAALPIASFLAELLQQLPNDGALIHAWENPLIRLGIPAALLLLLATALALFPAALGRVWRAVLLALSPVALLVVYTITTAAYYRHPVVVRDAPPPASVSSRCGSVVALLFDELSFAYLYDGSAVKRDYPAIRALADTATQYLHVTAPGHETLVSLPGYLAVRHFTDVKVEAGRLVSIDDAGQVAPFSAREPDALFASARRAGLATEMAGYYLPYCELLGDLADSCQSLSFYNVARTGAGLSPFDALRTTLVLWPRQFPFGLLKNPPFARLQRGLVEHLAAFAGRPLPGPSGPVFRFVHFSIPHLPFVFAAEGFRPPFNPLHTSPDDAYVAQIGYVDRLVGDLMDRMKRAGSFDRTTVIVFSDHGFRFGGREDNPVHIPFIVKHAGQTVRQDVLEEVRGEELLRDQVVGACRAKD